jgi:acyl carrier protein phosphodiesterase
MNWLAHAFLSSEDADFRLGNLLADVVKGSDLERMPPGFLAGVRCHRAIDRFTDGHPVWHRSRARIGAPWRRFSGVFVDVFYDHFLARNWDAYSDTPLREFTSSIYRALGGRSSSLPEHARHGARIMAAEDHLGAYERIEGVEAALRRISRRLAMRTGKEVALEGGAVALRSHYREMDEDFAEFFPQVRTHALSLFGDGPALRR